MPILTTLRKLVNKTWLSARSQPLPSEDAKTSRQVMTEASENTATPKTLFGHLSDAEWFWQNTIGRREDSRLQSILPALPDESVQLRFTGSAGDHTLQEAFLAYLLFKEIVREHLGRPCESVLDFGCGWGRIIRFFLKDIEPANLWGVDCYPEMIDICRQTNHWSRFEVVEPFPPATLPSKTFDLIYCYSVFSHLSEQAHQAWLAEFCRILKPGGLIIATTWPREFILRCAELRKEQSPEFWTRGPSRAFLNTAQSLQDYDEGKYVHEPVGGGDILSASFFGETCIPQDYVARHWTQNFKLIDFITDRNRCPQNVIVVKK